MRIHINDADTYMHALATALWRDPASLEFWHALHIHPIKGGRPLSLALTELQARRREQLCDVILAPTGDVLLLSRDLPISELEQIALDICELAGSHEMQCDFFNLQFDRRELIPLLEKLGGDARLAPLPPPPAPEGVEGLQETFAVARQRRQSHSPQRVMIIEDDPLTRRQVGTAFQQDFSLISAHNARDAVTGYLTHAPDIVFLDVGLPDMNGITLLRQIMQTDPDAYVVMFSGGGYLENVLAALNAGAAGFVTKPFRRERMEHYIHSSALHHEKRVH